ncbi:MAG: helix-turn-helix transcriptional regulator [Ruminococcus sp.]|nr:helix-turn-helix transcriptional regulator [Ruminococcus sp.]
MKKEFKDIIKELRLEKDWTQAELGAKLNVTAQTVSKWEKGTMPDISLIRNIANMFSFSTDYLLGREEQCKESVEAYLERVKPLIKEGNYIETVEILEKADERFPGNCDVKHKLAFALLASAEQYAKLYQFYEDKHYKCMTEREVKEFNEAQLSEGEEPLSPDDYELVSEEKKREIDDLMSQYYEKISKDNLKKIYARAADLFEYLITNAEGNVYQYINAYIMCCTETDQSERAKRLVEEKAIPISQSQEILIGRFSNDHNDRMKAMKECLKGFFEMSDGLRISGSESKEELISLKETDLASLAFLNALSAGDNKGLLKHICPLLIRLFCTCAYLNEEDDAKEYYEQLQRLRETDSKAVHDALHKSLQQLISLSYKNDLSNELSEMNASLMIINDNE